MSSLSDQAAITGNSLIASLRRETVSLTWPDCLDGCSLYHITPLHYLPSIMADGALFAKGSLSGRGIRPRSSAFRRDRMLGLSDFIHFSLEPVTPLLTDKLQQGFPHVVLTFDAVAVCKSASVAILPGNTKRWASKAALQPIGDPFEMAKLVRTHRELGRLPSLEVLVKSTLKLDAVTSITFATDSERLLYESLRTLSGLDVPMRTLGRIPTQGYSPTTLGEIREYFAICMTRREVLPPPDIQYD